jgi:hypothetical protein
MTKRNNPKLLCLAEIKKRETLSAMKPSPLSPYPLRTISKIDHLKNTLITRNKSCTSKTKLATINKNSKRFSKSSKTRPLKLTN